jgi:hypothetical protein
MKKIYQQPQITTLFVTALMPIMGSTDEQGKVPASSGDGKDSDGNEYIVLGKDFNAWNTWDDEEDEK